MKVVCLGHGERATNCSWFDNYSNVTVILPHQEFSVLKLKKYSWRFQNKKWKEYKCSTFQQNKKKPRSWPNHISVWAYVRDGVIRVGPQLWHKVYGLILLFPAAFISSISDQVHHGNSAKNRACLVYGEGCLWQELGSCLAWDVCNPKSGCILWLECHSQPR